MGRPRRLDAEALALQVQPFPGQAEHGGGLFHAAAALRQGVLQHRALEVLDGGRHRLVEPDDDLGGIEGAFRRGDRPARGGNVGGEVFRHHDRAGSARAARRRISLAS